MWFGLLGAPAAWTIELLSGYSLEEWFACSPATTTEGLILGVSVRSLAIVIPVATAGVAVLAGLVAAGCLRRISSEPDDHVTQRARWMALAGVLNSVLYGLVIVTSLVAPLLLDVCATTP